MTSPLGVSLGYDAAGRLSKYAGGPAAVRFSYAGLALIQETYDPGGPIIRRYVPGPSMDEPVVVCIKLTFNQPPQADRILVLLSRDMGLDFRYLRKSAVFGKGRVKS